MDLEVVPQRQQYHLPNTRQEWKRPAPRNGFPKAVAASVKSKPKGCMFERTLGVGEYQSWCKLGPRELLWQLDELSNQWRLASLNQATNRHENHPSLQTLGALANQEPYELHLKNLHHEKVPWNPKETLLEDFWEYSLAPRFHRGVWLSAFLKLNNQFWCKTLFPRRAG